MAKDMLDKPVEGLFLDFFLDFNAYSPIKVINESHDKLQMELLQMELMIMNMTPTTKMMVSMTTVTKIIMTGMTDTDTDTRSIIWMDTITDTDMDMKTIMTDTTITQPVPLQLLLF